MIRHTTLSDIETITDILSRSVKIMQLEGNPQWSGDYPSRIDFIRDISSDTLFGFESEGTLKGFICINQVQPPEYEEITWNKKTEFYALHRMAVDPDSRRKGIAKELISFAEDYAKENDIFYIRTDTFSKNNGMNRLFESCGYNKTGEVHFRGIEEHFNCYDKIL